MQDILTQLTNLPLSEYTAALGFIGAGAIVSITLQLIKHFKGINSAVVSRTLVSFLSFVVATANYILSTPSQSLSVLASHTAMVLGAAHVVYWVSVSPAYKWFVGLLTDASSYRQISAPQGTSVAEQPPATFAE